MEPRKPVIGGKYCHFKNPSCASSFVLGAPTNGNVEWKTEDGKTFKEAEAAETAEQ